MKANKYIIGFLALFAAHSASALTFEITGATAFRQATIQSIHALYTAGGDFRFVHNKGTAFENADFITFEGTISGLPGTTIIRCSFNGSIDGLRALAQPGNGPSLTANGNAFYLKTSSLSGLLANPGTNVAVTVASEPSTDTKMERAVAEMAFSDTEIAISPFADAAVETLGSVGGVAFACVSSEGSGITNVTHQQLNSLITNGFVPKSFFTGNPADTSRVFWTGRNDGSGTRSSYLAETGYGVSVPVNQYLVIRSSGNENTVIQRVPAGGTNDTDPVTAGVQLGSATALAQYNIANGGNATGTNVVTQLTTSASTAWGQNVDGNGGAFSGSAITGPLARLGSSVRCFAASGANLFGGVPQTNVALVSWISVNDAIVARGNTGDQAIVCSFNGVSLDVATSGTALSTADRQKITSGQYSAWNFQQFYRLASADSDTITLYETLHAEIKGGNLGAAGIPFDDFTIGRNEDGGTINPFE